MTGRNESVVVEEVIIVEEYEDCEDGEDGDWVLGEDGYWYCTVEEVEEIEEDPPDSGPTRANGNHSMPLVERKNRAASLFSLPENLRTGTSCLIEIKPIRSKSPPLQRRSSPTIQKTEEKEKKKSRTPNIGRKRKASLPSVKREKKSSPGTPKKEKKEKEKKPPAITTRRRSESTLSVKNEASPLSRIRAKQQAASNKIAIAGRIESMRQRGREKIFGETLENLVIRQRDKLIDPNNPPSVPRLVYYFVEHIRARGLRTPGLFRECGRHSTQLEKEAMIEAGIPFDELGLEKLDIHTVADILKSFFRQLPDPIIPRVPFCSLLIQESGIPDVKHRVELYSTIVRTLPPIRFEFLSYIVKFMVDVTEHKDVNLMDSQNVAKIFASLILGSLENDMKKKQEVTDPMILFMETNETTTITKLFVDEYENIFSGLPCQPRIYRVTEAFKPTSSAYMAVERDDIVIFLHETDSGAMVAVDQTVGEIPKSILEFNMKLTKLNSLHVADVGVILARKMEKAKNKPK